MKKIISIAVTTAMVVTLASGTAFAGNGNSKGFSQKDFKDMKGHWGYQSVQKMQNYGIFDGYSDGTFRPDECLSGSELAVLIERLVDYKLGKDESNNQIVMNFGNSGGYGNGWGSGYNWGSWGGWGSWGNQSFYNVPSWAQQAVWYGAYNNYLNPNQFNPTQTNRVTAIVAIAKALGLEPEPVYTYNPFSDGKLIADEDLGYVLAMYNEGYISGYPDGSFNPNATLTRAQMATIIEKLLENMGDADSNSDDDNAPTWAKGSEITASNVNDTSVTLKWDAAKDDVKVTGYKVIYKVDGKEKTKTVTNKTVTITGLEADEDYTFTVEARDAAGNWSDDGPSVDVTTADADDEDNDSDAPYWNNGKITATTINTDNVTLEWSGAKDDVKVTGYKVTYKVNGTEKAKNVTDKTVKITGLEENTKYTFTVEAKDADGNWSTDGPSIKVTTLSDDEDTKAPTWPSDASLTVSQSSSGIVTLVWPEADDNVAVTAYKIYQDGKLIKTVDKDTTNINVTGLDNDTEYTFKVKAADAAGNLSSGLTNSYTTD